DVARASASRVVLLALALTENVLVVDLVVVGARGVDLAVEPSLDRRERRLVDVQPVRGQRGDLRPDFGDSLDQLGAVPRLLLAVLPLVALGLLVNRPDLRHE